MRLRKAKSCQINFTCCASVMNFITAHYGKGLPAGLPKNLTSLISGFKDAKFRNEPVWIFFVCKAKARQSRRVKAKAASRYSQKTNL